MEKNQQNKEFLKLAENCQYFDISQEQVYQVGGVREKPKEGKKCPSCGHFTLQPSIMIEEGREIPVQICKKEGCRHWE